MIQRRWQLWLVFLIFAWPVRLAVAQDRVIPLKEALNTTGTVIMIRHALAPGFGDPSNFRVDDCRPLVGFLFHFASPESSVNSSNLKHIQLVISTAPVPLERGRANLYGRSSTFSSGFSPVL